MTLIWTTLKSNIEQKVQFWFDLKTWLTVRLDPKTHFKVRILSETRLDDHSIISIHISFLLCLADMNKLNVYFNNIINQMIQNQQIHLVVRRYDHVFLLWHIFAYHVVVEFFVSDLCFLIEIELRRFHRRFDHFSICRLYQILQQTQQKIDL